MRKTSKYLSLFEGISHESVRIYYHRLKKVLKQPRKKSRRLIAIDETKLKLEKDWFEAEIEKVVSGREVDVLEVGGAIVVVEI